MIQHWRLIIIGFLALLLVSPTVAKSKHHHYRHEPTLTLYYGFHGNGPHISLNTHRAYHPYIRDRYHHPYVKKGFRHHRDGHYRHYRHVDNRYPYRYFPYATRTNGRYVTHSTFHPRRVCYANWNGQRHKGVVQQHGCFVRDHQNWAVVPFAKHHKRHHHHHHWK